MGERKEIERKREDIRLKMLAPLIICLGDGMRA
jgi:hypothetical protein